MYLAYLHISSDILSGSFWHSNWYIFGDLWLESGREHGDPQFCCSGPAGNTVIQRLQLRSGGKLQSLGFGSGRKNLIRSLLFGGGPANIKSNNPHLTGEENSAPRSKKHPYHTLQNSYLIWQISFVDNRLRIHLWETLVSGILNPPTRILCLPGRYQQHPPPRLRICRRCH